MSISSIRSATEKKGCQALLVVLGVLLAAGMVFTSFQFGQNQQSAEQQGEIAFTMEGQTFTKAAVEEAAASFAQNSAAQFGFPLDRTTPTGDFQALAGGMTQLVNQQIVRQMADEYNVSLTDEALLAALREQLNDQITQFKLQLQLTENIEPDKIDQAFTERAGRSEQEIIADTMTQYEEMLKVPAERKQLELPVIGQAVIEKFNEQVNFTEEDLKKSYDSYTFEEVALDSSTLPTDELQAEAEKAREELVGGATPAEVRKKYSPNSTRTTTTFTRDMMTGNPSMEPLMELQPGEVSEVLDPYGFPAVFKLVSVKQELPENFEANKASLLENRKQQEATRLFQEAVAEKNKNLKFDWKDGGYKIIWEVRTGLTDMELQGDALTNRLRELYDDARAVATEQGVTPQLASLASYNLAENLLNLAGPEEKEAAMERWTTEVNDILSYYDSVPFRLALYNQYDREGQTEEAFTHLLEAARINRDFTEVGQDWYGRVVSTTEAARTDKTFTEEQLSQLDQALTEWVQGKNEYDAEQEAWLKEQEELNKELDNETINPGEGTTGTTGTSGTEPATSTTGGPATTGSTSEGN